MWQAYSVLSSFFSAFEESIDKANIVRQKTIGLFAATWIRNVAYTVIAFFAALLIEGHGEKLLFTAPILMLGAVNAANSIFYTVLLQRLEITASGILFELTPFVFLFTDMYVTRSRLSPPEVLGIFLLVVGGWTFLGAKSSIAAKDRKKKLAIGGIFLFNLVYYGFYSYLFKYYSAYRHVTETRFLLSGGIATVFFLSIVCLASMVLQKRVPPRKHVVAHFTAISFTSKIADYASSYFFLSALALASVAQVSAMESFYPVILMLVVIVLQGWMHVRMKERLDRKSLAHKLAGVVLISLGMYLVH